LQLIFSIFLAALWIGIDTKSGLSAATLCVLLLRTPLFGLQVSMYIRRLNDAAMSRLTILSLLGIYAAMTLIALTFLPSALDESAECQSTGSDGCGEPSQAIVFLAGLGPLTGIPGPFSFLFGLTVGFSRSRNQTNSMNAAF
jgi:hypothetical protein